MSVNPVSDGANEPQTMENICKTIKECLDMLLGNEALANDCFEIDIFRRNPGLREPLEARLELDLSAVLQSKNINGTFRGLIVTTIQVAVVNQLLIQGAFADDRELICGSINRGIALSLNDDRLTPATELVQLSEAYPEYTWCYEKALHENAWAEMKLRVLKHLLVHLFGQSPDESVPDWWDFYRKAYRTYIAELYALIVKNGPEHKGIPHPIVVALSNETLITIYEKLTGAAVAS